MFRRGILTTKPARIAAAMLTLAAALATSLASAQSGPAPARVSLTPCRLDGVETELRCGVYNVFENRQTRRGRLLPLKIVLIPARAPHPDRGPIFYLAGGPGETVTEMAPYIIGWGDNSENDVVLVDERGTSEGSPLDCASLGSDDNLEGYLKGPFDPAATRLCRARLEQSFDLSQYTTAAFVEDLEEVRRAMGYDRINLSGGSFGTYAGQMYLRRYGEHVRSAYLVSLVTLSNRVPLYLAEASQQALDQLFSQCEQDTACRSAYPQVRKDFAAVLAKVHAQPVLTWVHHPVTGKRTEVHLSERAFVDAVRVMLYSSEQAREIPFLIGQANAGDFNPFAEVALRTVRGIYGGVRVGLNYAITCNEFVNRIRPEDVEPATRGTYFGSWRVNSQMAVCSDWAKTNVPAGHFEPFRSDVPALLVSGDTDPGTPPRWGEEVKSFMPNATHIVVRGGGHTPENACTRAIRGQLFRTGTTRGLDLSCVAKLQPAPFKLPANR